MVEAVSINVVVSFGVDDGIVVAVSVTVVISFGVDDDLVHYIAGLASTNPHFSITEWDRLLEQGLITLNLLRNARLNPNYLHMLS